MSPAPRSIYSKVHDYVRQESLLVAALLLIVGAGWAFLEVLDEVREGEARAIDQAVIGFLRSADDPAVPLGPHWLVTTALDLTALGSTSVITLVTVLVAGYLALQRAYGSMWLVIVASAAGGAMIAVLKLVFDRERPDDALHLAEVTSASFPSGHTTASAVVYLTLAAVLATTRTRRRERVYIIVAAALLTVIVGLTRVYLGVHFATDVLAGWSLGLAWALLCLIVAYWLRRRRVITDTTDNAEPARG